MRKKIVLFHSSGEDHLLRTNVLNATDYCVYDVMRDIEYNTKNIINALIYCLRYKPKFVRKNYCSSIYCRILWREFKAHIIASNIRYLQPAVVLTWIDNSDVFHRVCKICTEIPFLAIANSARTSWCVTGALPDVESKYYADELFCYGPRMRLMFEKHSHEIKKYIACGSLLGGYYFSTYRNPKWVKKEEFDICIISQWHKTAWDLNAHDIFDTGQALEIKALYVAQYAKEHNLKVCIALRGDNPAEKSFFDNIFSGECIHIESNRDEFSSYKAADMSNLVVAINSSLAVELFGGGMKVLFINPSGKDEIRQTDSSGIWYLSKPSYSVFSQRLDHLLCMSTVNYQHEAYSEMVNVMTYELNQPAHTLIRKRLLQIVSETNKQEK